MEYGKQEDQRHARRASTPYLRRVVTDFYRTALEDYRRAGYPFGKSVEAMLVWFEYNQDTTAN